VTLPVVLVHGGGHGSWCWQDVVPLIDGPVIAVDLPPKEIRGVPGPAAPLPEGKVMIADMVESIIADADAAGFDRFVLVGHSFAGLSIAGTANAHPDRVAQLVFVSCIVPAEGESVIPSLDPAAQDMVRDAVAAGTSPVATFDEATVRHVFCNDFTEEQTAFELAHFGTDTPHPLGEVVSRRGIPPELPKTWVRLGRDQMIEPARQDLMIEHLRASPGGVLDVVELDAGHNVMISQPQALADIINKRAQDS